MLSIKQQIITELDKLTDKQQEQLLNVARQLQYSSLPPGTPGEVMLAYMDNFEFTPGAVDEMMRIIEEGCERIDWDGWQ
ncbi:MAG: hypothetical protein K8L97_26835 [Anaerolineae bacterium]|nr:hypothetical protein [Anaerolineae bacterium]